MSRNAPMKDWNLDCKVYVGDLGHGCAKQELEEKFSKYGNLANVWIARKPPGFAFVEFEDHRDADDAVRGLDGTRINGKKVKVEMSSGKSRWGNSGPPRRGGGGGGGYRNYYDGRGGGGGGGHRGMGGPGSSRRRSRSRSYSPRRRSRSRSFSESPRRRRRSRSRS